MVSTRIKVEALLATQRVNLTPRIQMARHFSNRNLMTGTYSVVIEDEGVLIFVEIVE